MARKLPPSFRLSPEVERAQAQKQPLVALESAVITHGLPYPSNLTLAEDMENEVRSQGAVPATIAVLDGAVCVGLSPAQLLQLSQPGRDLRKISTRDYGAAIASTASGGTTVAGTLLAAYLAGLRVFATGGIGGVHHNISRRRGPNYDISADLPALAHIPVLVVCAGAKAILNLSATLEYLETWGVPVVGYQTNDFPAFYSQTSGLKTSASVETPQEAARLARAHWSLGIQSAVLVVVPPPEEVALPPELVNAAVRQALREARERRIRGPEVTPYLLERVRRLTRDQSLRANIGLLLNNARLAAQIAHYIY
jgi:pseudouridine-5'-phosphate glycosidase